jgi:hypothetical protein
MENLAKAIIKVMEAVKGIDKSMTVGSGASSYKGVPDKEVKVAIGKAMQENGLCMLPIGVDAKTKIDRWEEIDGYGKMKQKQSVFTEVKTKYLLLHDSGESQVLEGYGQGIDSQDKGAGKATTYALKYALLYSFLVPTGKIEDSDNDRSDNKETPPDAQQKAINNEVTNAIQNLVNCKTKEDLSFMKEGLSNDAKNHPAYKKAAVERFNQINQK